MTEGYIYCFSNPSMPGILKVGMTERTPEARLSEANSSDTWRPPTLYKIEFAKKIFAAKDKEKALHALLEQYTDRINPRREFFRVTPEEVRKFFDLMDGEMWVASRSVEEETEEDDENEEASSQLKSLIIPGCRDMTKCFTHGQRIRHIIGINKTWIGTYDLSRNAIIYNDTPLSIYKFASNHYVAERPDRTPSVNGWKECECEVNELWISTYSLPELKSDCI